MRALLASTLTLAVLIGCWLYFYQYSTNTLYEITNVCQEEVMPAIEDGQWNQAYDSFHNQYQVWHRYRKRALYMLETDKLNDADTAFSKTLMYIKAEDLSNSSGELLALQESLKYLHENEAITLTNIL